MACSCSKKTDAAGAARAKPITVAFPDGTKKSYDSDTQARVAAAAQGGKVLVS